MWVSTCKDAPARGVKARSGEGDDGSGFTLMWFADVPAPTMPNVQRAHRVTSNREQDAICVRPSFRREVGAPQMESERQGRLPPRSRREKPYFRRTSEKNS